MTNRARTDLISLACVSASTGMFLMVAIAYFIAGDWLGFIFAACGVAGIGAALVIGRRALETLTPVVKWSTR